MQWIQAIVLGIAQGLTEFLPISSTAHLRIVPAFLGWDDPGAYFTAIVQLGTDAAVIIYFRHDLARIARTWLGSLRRPELRSELDARMGWYVLIGTIPIAVLGLLFDDVIETTARSLYLIGTTLILLGLVLWAADRLAKHVRDLASVRLPDAVLVGFAQACALIPGVSRSGATLTMGLFLGFKRDVAARFSFLLSIPAIVLAGVYSILKIATGSTERDVDYGVGPMILATLVAFVVGYVAIAFLLKWLATHTVGIFVIYRVALGALVLALALSGVIS